MSKDTQRAVDMLLAMAHTPVLNYVYPGLTSLLLANGSRAAGQVRLFQNSREQHMRVTPHSHRYDLVSFVLRGTAVNRIWYKNDAGDEYMHRTVTYASMGDYSGGSGEVGRWSYQETTYLAGSGYAMTHDQIHSIDFSRDAVILLVESPERSSQTAVLEPYVHGEMIPTLQTAPWMFKTIKASEPSA